jgi:isoquinoline 1-oxidoreductase
MNTKNNPLDHSEIIEFERYELFADPPYQFHFSRRDFIKVFGGGIVLIVPLTKLLAQEERQSGESGRGGNAQRVPQEIGAWIHVNEDGLITAFTGKVELGQNIRTSLAQVVAEELRVPVRMVRLTMADTDLTPFDMGTFGSRTTPTMAPQLRRAAAATRELLIDLAAQQWNVDRNSVRIADARFVNHDASRTLTFADVAKGLKLVKVIPDSPPITPVEAWKISGTSVPKVDGADFVTGKHRYTSDVTLPEMMFGRVVRPSGLNAELVSVDTKPAEAIGARVVRDGPFLGVVAGEERLAAQATNAIQVEWKSGAKGSNADLFETLRKPATNQGRQGRGRSRNFTKGSIADGLANADKQLKQTYTIAYIAHAPLEPRAAVAEWKNDKLTVWTGTQRPFGVRDELAEAFRLPNEKVRVIVPDTGSAYGGKHTGECAVEAARLARAAGKPVKLVWSREEEFSWAYFRPAGVIDVKSGIKNDGTITAWEFHNFNSGPAAIQHRYEITNQDMQFHASDSPLRQGSYRALAATANHFARETHIDELAHLVNIDPLDFRLKNLKDERMRAVLEAVAKAFRWDPKKSTPNRGVGIAGGFEKGGYVATCAEVQVDRKSGSVKIVRVVEAFECGAVINPLHLHNQIEGAIVMGIGGALFEEIEFADGKILNGRFSRYRLPRFSDMPTIEIVIVDRKDLPSVGAGETPIVGLAPAVGNAIFNATGVRLRSLPLAPKGLVNSTS